MRIIKPYAEIMNLGGPIQGEQVLRHIELCGRVCYKSEDKITGDSARKFVKSIIDRGHEAVLEHYSFSVRFVVDRGVSHELVRHRIASFCQESTRYCNYGKENEVTFIEPFYFTGEDYDTAESYKVWKNLCFASEQTYLQLLAYNKTPQEARSVLCNSLKTEVVMTANLREWRHFFNLRTAKAAHPQMREVTIPLLRELKTLIPVVFDDIEVEDE